MIVAGSDSEHTRTAAPTISALQMDPLETANALLNTVQAILGGATPTGPVQTAARFIPRASTRGG